MRFQGDDSDNPLVLTGSEVGRAIGVFGFLGSRMAVFDAVSEEGVKGAVVLLADVDPKTFLKAVRDEARADAIKHGDLPTAFFNDALALQDKGV